MDGIEIAVSCLLSAFIGWEAHRVWDKHKARLTAVPRFHGRLAHMWRAAMGRDPHSWTRRETLHGVEKMRGDGLFLGQGSVTYTWSCSCGEETDLEPYEGAGA